MPDLTEQQQIALYDLNADGVVDELDAQYADSIGMTAVAAAIRQIAIGGQGELDIKAAVSEVGSAEYQQHLLEQGSSMYRGVSGSNGGGGGGGGDFLNNPVFQSTLSSTPAPGVSKKVLDWSAFWSDTNVPVIGYDAVDNVLVVLKGADHSADSSKDILVYDFTTGAWTKGDTKFSASLDISNMMTAPDTGELVALHVNSSAANNLKRFKVHQSANISSSTVNIVTPFFDFGSSGAKKRLYKVSVLAHGANLDDLAIVASYDGNAGTYSDIFTGSNALANTTADDWDAKVFTVTSPTDFNNVSVKIYSTGAMTTANWGISEISFIYREKGYR